MGRVSFENFGRLATSEISWTELAGRYSFQDSTEPYIVADIAGKLRLGPSNTLLEIGCGAGNLLISLARLVGSAIGIDHENLLRKLGERSSSIRRLPGNFLDIQISERFSRILIYSVLHYLANETEMTQFVMKAAGLLAPQGLLLIGDIANVDKKRAFETSPRGRDFLLDWRRRVSEGIVVPNPDDPDRITIDDGVLDRLQSRLESVGFEVMRLAQPEGLPMCYTREDMLVSHAMRPRR